MKHFPTVKDDLRRLNRTLRQQLLHSAPSNHRLAWRVLPWLVLPRHGSYQDDIASRYFTRWVTNTRARGSQPDTTPLTNNNALRQDAPRDLHR